MSNIFQGNSNTRTATGRSMNITTDPNQLRTGTGMVGSSTGQRIIGANAAGGTNATTTNRTNTTRRNNNNNGQNFANMLQQLGQNGQQQNNMMASRTKPPLQPQYKVGFETASVQPQVVTRDLNKVLTTDAKAKVYVRNMKVESQPDGVVVMRGQVATEQQRKMAELMARLEPGVKRVENQLTVAPETPAAK
ncbi:MAG: BON domain-containing protein [Planctomycetales bacterium]